MAMEKVTFLVQGMTCGSCVSHIERALKNAEGVLTAQVNLATERATVKYIASVATLDDFKQAVARAGYEVLEVPEQVGAECEHKIDQEELKLATARIRVRLARWVTREEDL